MDFSALEIINAPIDLLKSQLFEKVSASAETLQIMIMLTSVFAWLNAAISKRAEIIALFQTKPRSPQEALAVYFGAPANDGRTDTSYPDSLKAISALADDAIILSGELTKALQDHGRSTAEGKRSRNRTIKVNDVTQAPEPGIMPSEARRAQLMAGLRRRKGDTAK